MRLVTTSKTYQEAFNLQQMKPLATDVFFGFVGIVCGLTIIVRGSYYGQDGGPDAGAPAWLVGAVILAFSIFVILNYRIKLKKYHARQRGELDGK